MKNKVIKVCKNPWLIIYHILKIFRFIVPDKLYLSILYKTYIGIWIDWENPKTYCEKLQWLKLYNRKPIFSKMVDKYAVKNYVKNIIGEKYIIPTIAVFQNPDKIDWDILPKAFVLKTTHGGGCKGVVICHNKSTFNKEEAISQLWSSYKTDIYKDLGEWPYKDVSKRIIAEELLLSDDDDSLSDYKIMCFNGTPYYIMHVSGRFTDHFAEDFYDVNWNLTSISQKGYKSRSDISIPKPVFINEMLELTIKLAKDLPHIRIDWYYSKGQIYFGEFTFFDGSGLVPFADPDDELYFGDLINLNQSYRG